MSKPQTHSEAQMHSGRKDLLKQSKVCHGVMTLNLSATRIPEGFLRH